jgi:hypothetical protein
VNISRSPSGRLEGTIQAADGDRSVPFSGTLELLKVLEAVLEAPSEHESARAEST